MFILFVNPVHTKTCLEEGNCFALFTIHLLIKTFLNKEMLKLDPYLRIYYKENLLVKNGNILSL